MNNSDERNLTRLEELEANEEFQKLPEDKKVILIAGEKILEMDQYFRNLMSQLSNVPGKINLNATNKNIVDDILKQVDEKLRSSMALKKEDILDMIDQRYNDEITSLENKYQFATQQAIKNIDESFNEALERVEDLTQFQIQAREEIRKNQDKIYILEEELHRQKENNDSLKRILDESIEKQSNLSDDALLLNNYEFLGKQFSTFDEFKEFVRDEARMIAENEIEKYLHEKDLFSEEFSEENLDNAFEKRVSNDEIIKMYELQINNGSKLDDLEKLIEQQNQQMKMLSEERQALISKISKLISDNKVNSSDEFQDVLDTYLNSENDNNEFCEKSNKELETNSYLSNNEIEFLIKNQAIELVKEKLSELSNKTDEEINEIILQDLQKKYHNNSKSKKNETLNQDSIKESLDELKTISHDSESKLSELEKVNAKILELQKQLRSQINENETLRNDLFDEISKNSTYNLNDDNINNDYIDFTMLNDEDDMSKHNYYDGKTPIPGTKITRINNYRINNDLDTTSFDETQEIIRTEVEKLVTNNPFEDDTTVAWQENNQKIVDLENLVLKQEEELNRLRSQNANEFNTKNIIETNQNNNAFFAEVDKQKEFMNSLEQTLNQLKELSNIQAQTVADLEKQSRKLEEIEQKVQVQEIANKFVTHDNLDEIISEKYKTQKADEAYVEELRKVEEERKRIEEALELERLRLMSEINSGKEKLNNLASQPIVEQQPQPAVELPKQQEAPKSDIVILETPKKKRKQQIFYEVKVHNRPKLTRADLEK